MMLGIIKKNTHATSANKKHKFDALTILALSITVFIIVLDGTLMNVSMESVIRDLNATYPDMQALITIYSLTMASLLLIGSKLGDVWGHKKVYLIGVSLFGIGALIAAFSKSISMLLIGWSLVEGVGAALMMPATLSILMINYKGEDRKLAFGIWGGVSGAGSALGPLIGGFITTAASWRFGFAFEALLTLFVFVMSKHIKDLPVSYEDRKFDMLGGILSATGMASFVYGILKAQKYGWFKAVEYPVIFGNKYTLGGISFSFWLMLLGLILITILIMWEHRLEKLGKTPIIPLRLFKNRNFVIGLLTSLILRFALGGIIFIIPLYLQNFMHYTAIQTGLATLPLTVPLFIMSVAVTRIKLSPKRIIQLGFLLLTVGIADLYYILAPDLTITDLIIPLGIFGMSMGLIMSQLTNVTLSAVKLDDSAEASGINTTLRQLGNSLGIAVMGTIMFAVQKKELYNVFKGIPGVNDSNIDQLLKMITGAGHNFNMTARAIDMNLVHEAIIKADKMAFLFSGILSLLALVVVTLFLDSKTIERRSKLS